MTPAESNQSAGNRFPRQSVVLFNDWKPVANSNHTADRIFHKRIGVCEKREPIYEVQEVRIAGHEPELRHPVNRCRRIESRLRFVHRSSRGVFQFIVRYVQSGRERVSGN